MTSSIPEESPMKKRGLNRTQARTLRLVLLYALATVIVIALAVVADWPTLADNFARGEIAKELFPGIITIALKNTIVYTLGGFAFGLVLGLGIALMRLSSVLPLRLLATFYIEIFRGLPALLIFTIIGVGLPLAFHGTQLPGGTEGKVMFALGLVSAAYMAETIRAGIQAIPKGQSEAARSLGMSPFRAMVHIVIPQAFRIVIPPLTNELVLLFKDSSLVLYLGIALQERELTKFGRDLAAQKANSTPILVAGLCYLLITIPLGFLVRWLESRNKRSLA